MNPPAFQLYAADFYMDTASWPIEAVGIYSRFLFYQWVNGYLPGGDKELARIAGCGVKKLLNNSIYWKPKFIQNGEGKLQNLRLEETRKAQLAHREKVANAGRIGGLTTQAQRKRYSSDASSDASSEPSSEIKALQSSSLYNTISYSAESCTLQVPEAIKSRWKGIYGAIDIEYEIKKMEEWVLANPKNKKTNWRRFMVNWLARAQDRAPAKGSGKAWKDEIPFL